MLLKLSFSSLYARLVTVGMTILAISVSLMLYMSVEKLRTSAYTSFTDTISQTDLIVGARASSVQLLLYSVFRIGNATNNITWESYLDLVSKEEVKWTVPISLGDSHKGFRVMGTNSEFFSRYLNDKKIWKYINIFIILFMFLITLYISRDILKFYNASII